MGKFNGKLLVSDMDATLLNSKKMVSSANRAAIEYFISEGGHFTVASGRMVPAVSAYFNQMTINAPAILHNGAKLYDYDTNKVVCERYIEEERKAAIKRVYDTHPELGLEVYADELVYVYRECFETERFKTRSYKVIYELPDRIWERKWTKVLIIGHKNQLDEFEPIYRRDYDKGYSVRSGDHFLDIVATGASKGNGLADLADMLKIDMKNVYAVGDNMNDIDMLQAAGHSFAVANAEQKVKDISDKVIPSCDDDPIAYIIDSI
ncbi:MAG: Cof-type HAD-IIB family hydrolase [bacterium]|nr:Cof-type HAD-IIB family hydrolase [bacterium]